MDHVLLLTIVIIIVLLLYHSLIATITFSQLVIRVSGNESIVGVLYCGHRSELLQLTFILLLALPTTYAVQRIPHTHNHNSEIAASV